MYTIIDLIDKLIIIERSGYELYREMAENIEYEERVKILAKVFSNQESKHIKTYENLKDRASKHNDIDIDFSIYDKAAKIIYEFSRLQTRKDIKSIKELLEFSLMFEKENLALVLSIRGIFVESQKDSETRNYEILSEIIKEEQKHVNDIEMLLK